MVLLDDNWLYRKLIACTPPLAGVPGTLVTTPAGSLSDEEQSLLKAAYGSSGHRYEHALNAYRLIKAKTRLLACDVGFAAIWPSLISAEWSAHLRLEDHLSGKLYRDHIFHPATVAMLGWELRDLLPCVLWRPAADVLENRFGSRYALDHADPNQTWAAVLDHAWLVAGFFHDHCYPVELLARQADALVLPAGRPRPDALTKYRSDARVQHRQGHFDAAALADIREGLRQASHSHAALGALSLHALKASAPNDFARAVLDIAADAVLWHHSCSAEDIEFAEHPVRYLLALCDGLHEFCRELALREETNPGAFAVRFVAPCREAELKADGNTLTITYLVDCEARPCASRWSLEAFERGVWAVQTLINSSGPLELACQVDQGDCPFAPT